MGMGDMIDFLFLACGAYLIGTSLLAKKQGNIVASVMLGKNMKENDIQDKLGFIDFMYKRLLLSGVLIMVAAMVHLINDYYVGSGLLTLVGIMIMFIALIIYVNAYRSGQKRYIPRWSGNNQKAKRNKK